MVTHTSALQPCREEEVGVWGLGGYPREGCVGLRTLKGESAGCRGGSRAINVGVTYLWLSSILCSPLYPQNGGCLPAQSQAVTKDRAASDTRLCSYLSICSSSELCLLYVVSPGLNFSPEL